MNSFDMLSFVANDKFLLSTGMECIGKKTVFKSSSVIPFLSSYC